MQSLVVGALGLAVARVLYHWISVFLKRRRFQQIHNCLPAPRISQMERIIGIDRTLENLSCWKKGRLLKLHQTRYNTVGYTFTGTIGFNPTIFTIEPENIKAVFADKFNDFDVGWQRLRTLAPSVGEVLFTSDGDVWRHQRALVRPAFNRRQISDCNFFESDIDDLISHIPRDGSTIDMAPLFYIHALNLATRLLFDEPLATLVPEFGSNPDRFLNAFRETNRGNELRFRMGRLLPLQPRDHKYESALKLLHTYADVFVHKALKFRKSWAAEKTEENAKSGERYIFLRELAKDSEDPIILRNHLLGMLVVGSETTASLMTICVYLASSRQDLWSEMRREVLGVESEHPDHESVKAMKLLNRFINEGIVSYPLHDGGRLKWQS